MSSSNFVHGCCHAFTPGRVASIANSKALLLGEGSLTGGGARNNTKKYIVRGNIGPTMVVAFITRKISSFCVEEGWDENLKHMKQYILFRNCSKIVPNSLSLFPAVDQP